MCFFFLRCPHTYTRRMRMQIHRFCVPFFIFFINGLYLFFFLMSPHLYLPTRTILCFSAKFKDCANEKRDISDILNHDEWWLIYECMYIRRGGRTFWCRRFLLLISKNYFPFFVFASHILYSHFVHACVYLNEIKTMISLINFFDKLCSLLEIKKNWALFFFC